MCILFFYANSNPSPGGYKLILASNRDEFFARPTSPAAAWENAPYAFGGIDLEPGREGGTWLGISGRNDVIKVGALLNLTGEPKCPNSFGRGPIVANYITNDQSNEDYARDLIAEKDRFSAFNFVSIELRKDLVNIVYCSNTPNTLDICSEDKCHAFGNSPHSKPLEKVKEGQIFFTDIVNEHKNGKKDDLVNKLKSLLRNPTKFWPDEELKRRAPNWGNHLSSINVRIPEAGYGSRTHTVILVDDQNRMDFFEDTMSSEDPSNEWKCTHLVENF